MSITFSGWDICYEKRRHLKPGQAPKRGHGYTMYHGTHKSSAHAIVTLGFRPSAGGTLGPGVYCSRDINKAMSYPAFCPPNERVVLRLQVRVGKVKKIDGQSMSMITTWHQNGYDTAWLPASMGRPEEDCVWDPKRLTVVGIEHCTDPATKGAMERLIQQQQQGKGQGQGHPGQAGSTHQGQCKICGKQMQGTHFIEKCWGCGTTICPFMDKHVCHRKG
ncbi:gig2-like protein DreN [Megalops cyprinoides]|uniref:gig2-like protein DreN n=1 Tax=Megalops cyprinoides TaxID=118141 RepID=UPI001864A147|nr:gig2-like protein DreN [Megalops cyprinoides]